MSSVASSRRRIVKPASAGTVDQCCTCSCWARSRRCATESRCRSRWRTGGCSRSSPCIPARTPATRWPHACGPTPRAPAPTCAPPSGPCARRSAPRRCRATRDVRGARPGRSATSTRSPGSRGTRRAVRRPRRRLGRRRPGRAPRRRRGAGSTPSRRQRTTRPTPRARAARRCALTPLDEAAHRVLMEQLAAAGDRAGALVVGRDLAGRLRAELGVGPAPATRAVLARLRGPGGAAGCGRAAAPDVRARPAELATLSAAWSAARGGHGQVVLVIGEAGIGKTRLVGELARRADNAGARVAVGAGVDVGGEAPLAMWQELARALVGACRAAGAARLARRAGPARTRPGARARPRRPRRRSWRRRSWSGCGSSTPCCGWSSGPRRAPGAARGRGPAPRGPREPRPVRAHRRRLAAPAGAVRAHPPRPAGPSRRRRVAGRPRRPRARRHRDRARPAGRRGGGGGGAQRRGVGRRRARAGGRSGRRQPAARGRERPGAGGGRVAPPPNLRAVVRAALGRLPDAARELAEAVAAAGRGRSRCRSSPRCGATATPNAACSTRG